MKFYLAGKVSPANDWRKGILGGALPYHLNRVPNPFSPGREKVLSCAPPRWAIHCYGGHEYTGPFYVTQSKIVDERHPDEPSFPEEWSHAMASLYDGGHGSCWLEPDRKKIFLTCVEGIEKCDVLFAWIEDWTAFGTLVEIGMAWGMGKTIVIAEPPRSESYKPEDELWFCRECGYRIQQPTPLEAYKEFLVRYGESVTMRLEREMSSATYKELESLRTKMRRVSGSKSASWRELITDWTER